jgi:di/tricarboxylate transporter
MVLAVVGLKVHVGVAAFAGAALVSLWGLADEREAYAKAPWSVIVMVCGVSLLTTVLDKTGGIDRFAQIIQGISTPGTASAVVALMTGLVSIYSSTTGVVIPVFLPMVKSLVASQPGADALSLSLSVLVGGNLVDLSPLSTIGALCLAAAPADADRRVLFRRLLIYGFVMALVGAGLCWMWF